MTKVRLILVIIVLILVVAALIRWPGIIPFVAGLFGLGVATNRDKIKQEIDKINIDRQKSKIKLTDLEKRSEKRRQELDELEQKAKDREERKKKLDGKFFLVLLICFIFLPLTVKAENIPQDYDGLLQKYLELVDITKEYRQLYEEAESDNAMLRQLLSEAESDLDLYKEICLEKDKTIGTLLSYINDLLKKSPISYQAGINLNPFNLGESGIYLGINFGF